jgi:spore germination cell wall hydrolase CwlJ-like protein
VTVSEEELDIFARTLWGEVRGESALGKIAAAWTIRNRVEDGKRNSWWGEGYAGVCQKPYQFSCWNRNDPNYPFLSGAKAIPAGEYRAAMAAAVVVIAGGEPDPTFGATHYYATTMPKPPAWAAKATKTATIGHHVFFRDVP